MAGSTVVSSSAHAYAVAEHAVLSVSATLYCTLCESSRSTADGDQFVELV